MTGYELTVTPPMVPSSITERNQTKGQTSPNSGFVDNFGLKVFEVYKPRQAELQQKLDQERQDEDDWDDGIAAEMRRDVLWDSIREAIPLMAKLTTCDDIRCDGHHAVSIAGLDRRSPALERAENPSQRRPRLPATTAPGRGRMWNDRRRGPIQLLC